MKTKPKAKAKRKIIHLAYDYPCVYCNHVDVECGEEVIDNDGSIDLWSMDEEKITCKACKETLKSHNY